jgi:hypothetical protein
MNRPPPRRSSQVQPEKPAPPAPPAEGPPPGEGPPPAPAAAPRLHWGWQLALFLWATSFLFLLLYDVLSGIFRVFRWLF